MMQDAEDSIDGQLDHFEPFIPGDSPEDHFSPGNDFPDLPAALVARTRSVGEHGTAFDANSATAATIITGQGLLVGATACTGPGATA